MLRVPQPPNRIIEKQSITDDVLYVSSLPNSGVCEAVDTEGRTSTETYPLSQLSDYLDKNASEANYYKAGYHIFNLDAIVHVYPAKQKVILRQSDSKATWVTLSAKEGSLRCSSSELRGLREVKDKLTEKRFHTAHKLGNADCGWWVVSEDILCVESLGQKYSRVTMLNGNAFDVSLSVSDIDAILNGLDTKRSLGERCSKSKIVNFRKARDFQKDERGGGHLILTDNQDREVRIHFGKAAFYEYKKLWDKDKQQPLLTRRNSSTSVHTFEFLTIPAPVLNGLVAIEDEEEVAFGQSDDLLNDD